MKTATWIVIVGGSVVVAGCGQKGPLYLPDKNASVVTRPAGSTNTAPATTPAPTTTTPPTTAPDQTSPQQTPQGDSSQSQSSSSTPKS
jgi:predicted small lipoprotein YifL